MNGTNEIDESDPPEAVLVTGFPAFTASRFVKKTLAADPRARVFVLVRGPYLEAARELVRSLPAAHAERVELVEGDVCDMDLGLSGKEYAALASELTTIHHMAGSYYLGVDRASAKRVNVDGTRGVLELARESRRLRRMCHWSTAAVSGKRKGVILEEELDEGQSFHNFYEETKFEAEKLARAAQRQLPITVLRPGVIVGDSQTGEIDRFDGPYYLMVLIATNALHLRVPLPGRGTAPLHLVPIDFVVDAAWVLSIDDRAAGRTFHITDPSPFAARRVYQRVAELSDRKKSFVPAGLARTVLRAPGLERIVRAPLSFLETFDRPCFYNARGTLELLEGTGLACPPLDRYVDKLVHFLRENQAARKPEHEDEVFDPFV